ncbi:nuclear transport factor 2 family protein [Xanthovirga aplysinae]|uniref:nuclear transport factor 2 family protein n=1 Tax=Xanthovirga aplysinae TaxID=2529853 RepID=UPI0016573740|nr:nuclear transport factor 2 family protein [Xanthovirga aplysinae]
MANLRFIPLIAFMLFSGCIYSQNPQGKMTNQIIVEKFLNGFNDTEKIQESLALLADDYKFKNPMVELNSKTEFIALAQKIGAVLTGVNLINLAENGEWVAAYYEFKSALPGLESNMATEWFRLENGIIKESHLIYDASEWRKVYAEMESK